MSVALINQVYSLQDGTNWHGTYVEPNRKVNASDLSCYYHHIYDANKTKCDPAPETIHGIAHSYGDYAFGSLTEGNGCESYTTVDDVIASRNNPRYFCRRTTGQHEFAYRFLEYNPKDLQRSYPYLTDRVITASSAQCDQYLVTNIDHGIVQDGIFSNYTYTNDDKTKTEYILMPVAADSFDGTIYIFRGWHVPEKAEIYACGDRCMSMWVFKNQLWGDHNLFFNCNVTVNEVRNAMDDAHKISNGMARIAASTIGLQGGKPNEGKRKMKEGWTQWSFYPIS